MLIVVQPYKTDYDGKFMELIPRNTIYFVLKNSKTKLKLVYKTPVQ